MTDPERMKFAVVTGEVMHRAAQMRSGDDAAWAGIGPDAHMRVVTELMTFAELAQRVSTEDPDEAPSGVSAGKPQMKVAKAATAARALGREILSTGWPVSEMARTLAGDLLVHLGVDEELQGALDGD